ncbi:TonB-dependent receptor [Hirschia baltica]|uniref:TonB-dependent receptor n=1 Tax=Hirschia baltica (strain ATCC 49814 / DSM 5838 / IFAM 1418) TaxID=582402 RepID=C6XKZ7_HIRBI|nr:TonB-dependent receptor [Hirschia baltica]ACT57826.1 TonB-dependent receptor [Hirschia baltica ATCC 49814]
MSKVKTVLRGATCLATLVTMSSPIAFAQEDTTQEENGRQTAVQRMLETVTVTATKQKDPENVQDIATSVTAFNASSLETLKVRDFEDLSYNAPNVSLSDVGTTKGSANFSMRGSGTNSSIVSIDPTIGVVVDGVPLGVPAGVVFDMFDLDSLEILRGPQGILQGRNTIGGVVAVNTGNPTDTLQYNFKFASETPIDDGRGGPSSYVQGAVSGPLIEGKLNGKIAAYYNYDEGYFKNLANNENHGEGDAKIIRGALEYMPTNTFTVLAKAEYAEYTGDGPASQNRSLYDRNSFDFAIDNRGFYDAASTFGTLRMDWDVGFGDGTITNITGYRKYEASSSSDIDSLPLALFDGPAVLDQEQLSNELRYNGSFNDLTVTTGIFYMDQSIDLAETRWIASQLVTPLLPANIPLPFPGGGLQDHHTLGVFAQAEYQFTDKFSVQAGLRYTQEEKDVDVTYIIPALSRGISNCSVIEKTCPVDYSDKKEWNVVTPKVAMEYKATDNSLLYASYNRGFRSGGYNFRLTDPAVFLQLNQTINNGNYYFDKETLDSFEVGYKYESNDGRVLLNSAVFFNQAEDMQREINVSSPTGVSQFIYNTADAEMKGLELEGRFAVTDNFLITGNVGYIDAKYTDIRFPISAVSVTDLATAVVQDSDYDLELPRTPELTYGLGFVWDQSLGNAGSLVTSANFMHRDENAYTDSNAGYFNAADMVNFDITWNTPKDGISISLYGKNMLDEVQAGGDTQIPFVAGTLGPATFSPLNKGRLVGLELSIKG